MENRCKKNINLIALPYKTIKQVRYGYTVKYYFTVVLSLYSFCF